MDEERFDLSGVHSLHDFAEGLVGLWAAHRAEICVGVVVTEVVELDGMDPRSRAWKIDGALKCRGSADDGAELAVLRGLALVLALQRHRPVRIADVSGVGGIVLPTIPIVEL